MSRYSAYLGRAVEVRYRAGDICLPASGKFVGDSGRSIFLEQHYEQHGLAKHFRWEIPYPCIVRLEESEILGASSTEIVASVHEEMATSSDQVHVGTSASFEGSPQPALARRAKTA